MVPPFFARMMFIQAAHRSDNGRNRYVFTCFTHGPDANSRGELHLLLQSNAFSQRHFSLLIVKSKLLFSVFVFLFIYINLII